jgi:hypothetical protein
MLSTANYFLYAIHAIELFNFILIISVALTWKKLSLNFKCMAIKIFLIAPFLFINYFFGVYLQMNNRFVSHLILHSDFILFSLFFFLTIRSVFWKNAIKLFALSFIIFSIFDYVNFESFFVNNPDNLCVLLNSWVVILSLVGYYEIYNLGKIIHLGYSPLFWMITALFFQNATAIFIYSTNNLWSYDFNLSLIMNFIKSVIWLFYILMLFKAFRHIGSNS